MKVACIMRLRDDTDIIRNLFIYYYNIGIKDFFIMLHFPTKELLTIIESIQKEIPINLRILWHNKEGKGLNPINEDYMKVLSDKALSEGFKWIVGTDSDEFLILRKHQTIQEFVSQFDNNEYVSLIFKWANYTLFKEKVKDKFYIEMQYRSNWLQWTKAIGKFNEKMYYIQGLHDIANLKFGQKSPHFKQISIDSNIAYYAHFPYRSKQQFIEKNTIQTHNAPEDDFRKEKLKQNPNYFDELWGIMSSLQIFPDVINPDTDKFSKEFTLDPINPKLMEI